MKRAADAERARRSLAEFVRQAWPVVEPGTPLAWNWHIPAICEHLEAVTRGQIRRLLINIPPGHCKSLLVSVFWPAWEWATRPETRSLFSSYAMDLAIRDSVRCRDLVVSDWYRESFRPAWSLKTDQNVKSYFTNDRQGFRFSMSVGGRATGFRGDKVVVDDPLNAKEQYSDLARCECIMWWDQVMSSRLNDLRTGARVIIMQRLHERDLAGHVLARGGYEHLCLPSEFEPHRRVMTSIGWTDPRTEPGELLFPELFPAEVLTEAKSDLGPDGYAGQHQQSPYPAAGGLFERGWFEVVDAAPAECRRLRFWDLAATAPKHGKDPDYTAGALLGRTPSGLWFVIDVRRVRKSPREVEQLVKQTAELDGRAVPIAMEQEPGSSGVNTIDYYTRQVLAGWAFTGVRSTGKKDERARPFSSQAQAGNVKLVRGAWNEALLAELQAFPKGHDDQVDAVCGAFTKLCEAPKGLGVLAQSSARGWNPTP